jgi:poly-gamma-glutamate synthesis protein (capsule biosynthesis protein)
MEIIVASDFCLHGRLAQKKDINFVSESLAKLIKDSDYSIVNLEAPVTTSQERNPRPKQGPNLSGGENVIPLIKSLGFSCMSLANNHIMDYGDTAFFETIESARKYEIDIVGAGKNLEDASRVLYIKKNEVKIAVINCCEHEFSIATDNKAGSKPLEPIKAILPDSKGKKRSRLCHYDYSWWCRASSISNEENGSDLSFFC